LGTPRFHQWIVILSAGEGIGSIPDAVFVPIYTNVIIPVIPSRGVTVVPLVGAIIEGMVDIVNHVVVIDYVAAGRIKIDASV
jgi:hypothetical protein